MSINPFLQKLVMTALVLVTSLPIHECAHAWVAKLLGDDTAKNAGRLTLNPLSHLDPVGSILILIAGVGWAKPVPVDTRNFKNPKRDMAICAVAGPVSNIILATVILIVVKIMMHIPVSVAVRDTFITVLNILIALISMNVMLGVFNMLPIPPMDGSRLLTALLPERIYYKIMRYEEAIRSITLVLVLFGFLDKPLSYLSNYILVGIDVLTGFMGRLYIL